MIIIRKINQALKYIKSNAWKYISFHDVIIVSIALMVSNFAYIVLTWFYPNTGEPSFQWLYKTIFGLTRASIVIGYSYLIVRLLFPKVFYYFNGDLDQDTEKLMPWQKISLYMFIYCFFLVVFLWSAISM